MKYDSLNKKATIRKEKQAGTLDLMLLPHSFLSVGRHWPRFVVKTIAWALAFVLQQVDSLISEKNESSEYSPFISLFVSFNI